MVVWTRSAFIKNAGAFIRVSALHERCNIILTTWLLVVVGDANVAGNGTVVILGDATMKELGLNVTLSPSVCLT